MRGPALAPIGQRRARLIDIARGTGRACAGPDASYDIATAIYLFHELPPKARREVAAELVRLIRPGGVCILVDSLQTGDRPDYDGLLDLFPVKFHEPYFTSYLREDLTELFGAAGFETSAPSLPSCPRSSPFVGGVVFLPGGLGYPWTAGQRGI